MAWVKYTKHIVTPQKVIERKPAVNMQAIGPSVFNKAALVAMGYRAQRCLEIYTDGPKVAFVLRHSPSGGALRLSGGRSFSGAGLIKQLGIAPGIYPLRKDRAAGIWFFVPRKAERRA